MTFVSTVSSVVADAVASDILSYDDGREKSMVVMVPETQMDEVRG